MEKLIYMVETPEPIKRESIEEYILEEAPDAKIIWETYKENIVNGYYHQSVEFYSRLAPLITT